MVSFVEAWQRSRAASMALGFRGGGGGVDEPRRLVDQIDFNFAEQAVGPEPSQRLGKGTHDQIRPGRRFETESGAARPKNAGGVGLVQIQKGVVPLGDGGDGRHVRAVAIHAENTFGNDVSGAFSIRAGFQQFIQVVEVVMAESYLARARALRPWCMEAWFKRSQNTKGSPKNSPPAIKAGRRETLAWNPEARIGASSVPFKAATLRSTRSKMPRFPVTSLEGAVARAKGLGPLHGLALERRVPA